MCVLLAYRKGGDADDEASDLFVTTLPFESRRASGQSRGDDVRVFLLFDVVSLSI